MKLHTKLPKNDTSSRKSAILATSIATLVGVSLLGFAPVAKAVQFWDTGLQNGILEGGSGTWDNAVTANWTNATDSLPHTTYAAGTNPAFFQGTAGTVTIAAANALAFSQLNFVASGYVVNGPGTLVLNNATNTINLQSPGTTTIAAPIRNGATGGLTVSNTGITGTLILTNAGNDYANGTTLTGTATLLNNAATSALGLGALTIDGEGSTFGIGAGAPAAVSVANDILITAASAQLATNSASTFTLGNIGLNSLSATNTITNVVGSNELGVTLGAVTINGIVRESVGPQNLMVRGGAFTFAGASANQYTGATTVQDSATLNLSKTVADGAILGDLTVGSTGVVNLLASNQIANSARVTVGAPTGTLNLGANTETIGTLAGDNGGLVTGAGNGTTTGVLTIGAGSTTYSGTLADAGGSKFGLVIAGGTQTLGGISSYTGTTTVNSLSTLEAAVANAFGADSAHTINGTMDLSGFSNTISSLSGTNVNAVVRNNAGGGGLATLTVNGTASTTYAGTMINGTGPLGLTKSGASTLTLSGSNSYTGATTITTGSGMTAGSLTGLSASSAFIVQNGSTLSLGSGASNGFSSIILSLSDGATSGGIVQNGGTTDATLTFGDTTLSTRFNGTIVNGAGGGLLGLIKQGTGTAILGGANTYTGATTINRGTLQAGIANQAFGIGSAVTINSSGALDLGGFNQTIASLSSLSSSARVKNSASLAATLTTGDATSTAFAGVIQDGSLPGGLTSLTKVGAGTFNLAGVNTYTGATNINVGTLQMGVANALSTGTAVTVAASATFDLNNFNQSIGSLAGAGTSSVALGTAVLTTGNDSLVNTTFSGVISGTTVNSGLTKVGTGSLTLDGAVANTYAGPTRVNDGVLILSKTAGVNAAGTGGGGLFIGDATGAAGSAILQLGAANQIADLTAVTLSSDGRFDLNHFAETVGSIAGLAGAQITLGSATLTTGDNANTTYAGSIGGTGGVTKQGTGAWTLSGNNTYSGATLVSAGALLAGSTTAFAAQSAFTVTGTLDLNGNSNSIGSLAGAGIVQDTGAAATLTITGNNGAAVNFSGQLIDGGVLSLVKNGAGTQILSGSNVNTYTGSTTVNGGILQAGAVNAFSPTSATLVNTGGTLDLAGFANTILSLSDSGAPGGTVTNTGAATTLTFGNATSLTFNGNITGPLNLTKQGAGIETLAGVNTYTGATTVNGGKLLAGSTQAFGVNSAVTVNNGGNLDLGGRDNTVGSLSGTAGGVVQNSLGAAILTTGGGGGSGDFSGNIVNGTAPLSLTKIGAGTQTLSGINTYTGATTINAGILRAGSTTGLSNTSAFLVNGGGTLDVNGLVSTILSLSDNGAGPVFGTVTNTGAVATVLTFGDANNLTFNGNIVNGASALGITKVGAGIEVLSGNNTYTGPTTINAGTLQAGSITAFGVNSLVAVNLNGTLDLGGFSNSVGALASMVPGGTVQNAGALAATLTITGTGLPQTFAGNIVNTAGAGALSLTKNGAGTQILSGVNTYNGVTTIGGGVLMAGSTTAFGTNSQVNITVAGAGNGLDLGGFSNSIGSLQGIAGSLATTTNGPAVLTTGGNGVNASFAGNLINGVTAPGTDVLSLTKVGTGIQTISGVNTYTGATNVNGGTLQTGSITALSATSAFLVNTGGILDLNGFSNTILSLTDIGTPGGTIQNGGVAAAVLTFGDANNLTFHGNIIAGPGAGTLGITKNGAGQQTMSGVNNYAGATTINNGALAAGSTTAFSGASAYSLTAAGTTLDLVTFNNSIFSLTGVAGSVVKDTGGVGATLTITNGGGANFAGNMIDNGPLALQKSGPGTQILSGINTYSGDTIIDGGILQAGSITAFSPNSDFFVNTGGTLSLAGFNNTILTLRDNGAPGGLVQNGAAGNAVLTFGDANSLAFNGLVQNGGAGTLGLTKNGAGAQTMNGLNTYTGPTTVNAGRLIAGSTSAYGVNSAVTVGNGGTLDLGGFQNTIGSLAGIPGSTVQNSTGVAATLTTGTLGTSTVFAGNLVNGAGAPLALTKVGAGTMTVSGVNTYTGATNVNAGVLQAGSITAFSAGSAHAVNTGGTLALNGFNNTILSLTDSGAPGGTVQNGGVANAILTFGDANNLTFRGLIQNGGATTLGITKNGTGAQTHSGVNTYTGPTTIKNGSLIGGSTSAFGVNSAVNLTAATSALDLGGFNNTIGSLTGAAGSTVTDSVANATLTTGTLNQNTIFAGNIIDGLGAALSLVKTGTGIQTLSGNNIYSGGTTINAGTILAGSTTALSATSAYNLTVAGATLDLGGFNNTIGSLAGVAGTTVQTVAGAATLTTGGDNTSTTFAGLITNSLGNALSLVKNGTGTLTITGANTYTGTTTHNSGGLLIDNDLALGAGNFVINNGGAETVLGSGVGGVRFANATQINGDFSVNPTGMLTASGPVTLNGTRTITGTNANTFNFGGPIGELALGTGVVFTSVPASIFQYSGLAANTYTGLTTVEGKATLQLNKSAGLEAIGTGGLTVQNAATVTSLADEQINDGATVLLNNAATFNLNGMKETITTLNTDAGATTVVQLDGGGIGGTLTLNNGTVNGQIIDNGFGGNLVKNGAAGDALTLTGANAYNGTTTLNSGLLNINNDIALGTSTLQINGGLVGNTDLLAVSHTFANSVVVQGDFQVNGPQQLISSGPVSLAVANTTIDTRAGGLDFNGVISEVNPVSNLTLTGATNTTFGGAVSNSYSGLTSVDAGTLTLAKTGGATAIAGHLNIASGATVQFGGPATSNQQVASTSNVEVLGTFNLNGHNQAISLLSGDGRVLLGDSALTAGQLTVNGGVFAGNISDNGQAGQLVKTSSATLVLSGTNSLTGLTSVQQGALVLNGSVGGNLIVFTPALLGGTGAVGGNLINNGTVGPGNSPGTLRVNGAFIQNPAGQLNIEIGGLAANQHDLLAVNGPAVLNGKVNIVSLNNFVLKRKEKVVFLTANQVNGEFSTEAVGIATDSAFLKATVLYESNTVSLIAEQLAFASVLKGLTPNQNSVAQAIDRVLNDSRMDQIVGFLDADQLSNVPHDLDLIAAEEFQAIYTMAISQSNVQTANLERRMDDIRYGTAGFSAAGLATSGVQPQASSNYLMPNNGLAGPVGKIGGEVQSPTAPSHFGTFITGVGEWSQVGSTSNASGYNLTTGGFTLGVDCLLGEHFALGINFGYARSSGDLYGNGNVTLDSAKLGIYATYFNNGFYVDGSVQGGLNTYDTRRTALQGTATGSTDGTDANALIAVGYDWRRGGLAVGPLASLRYTNAAFDSFGEKGSLAPLQYSAQSGESLRSTLGFKASYELHAGSVVIKPELRAAWQHEFGDTAFAINSRFANGAGNNFTVQGAEIGADSVLVGAGVAVVWNKRTSTYVYYDGELGRTNFESNNLSVGVRIEF